MAENCPFDVTPLLKAEPVGDRQYSLDYVCQDYWSLKPRLIELCSQNFGEHFNDFSEASIPMMLIQAWAFLADTLSFKIDQLANEVFIDTVTEPENAFRLARLVGFRPRPPVPARAMFNASLNNPLMQDLRIRTPLKLPLPNPGGPAKTIELFAADVNDNPVFGEDIVIPAGTFGTESVVGIEGLTHVLHFTGTGEPGQILPLTTSVLWKSVQVDVDGIPWKEVEYYTAPEPLAEFRVEYNWHYQGYVVFGDNKTGKAPAKGSTITVTYRTGGGTVGNIVTGSVEQAVNVSVTGVDHKVIVQFKNYTRGEFGYNGDTIEEIRRSLPAYLRTQGRCVTGHDYKTTVDQFGTPYNGVIGKSTVVLRNHGCAGNVIDIYILAREGQDGLAPAGDNLKAELLAELSQRKMFTDHVCVRDGEVLYVDVQVEVVLDRVHRRSEEQIRERIVRRLNKHFALAGWEFGQGLREEDIIKALADVREAGHFDITFTTTRQIEEGQGGSDAVSARYYEIIRPDNVTVSFTYGA